MQRTRSAVVTHKLDERQVSNVAIPTWDVVEVLRDFRAEDAVSIYLPVHRRGRDVEQDPLRLRNLLDLAGADLAAEGRRSPDIAHLLQPARDLLQESPFWSHQEDGLALFLAPDQAHVVQLPFAVPELAVTGRRFHVRPLILGLLVNQEYYALVLSRREPRLLQGDRFGLREVPLTGAPPSFEEYLLTIDVERQFQARTGARTGNRTTAIFHGHGAAADDEDERVIEYFRQLDEAIMAVLRDERVPLVLAGMEHQLPLFRAATRYPNVLEDAAEGNTEPLDDGSLLERMWGIVEPLATSRADAERARYDVREAREESVYGLEAVLPAAVHARVDSLFLAEDAFVWGSVEEDTGRPLVHDERRAGDEELLDRALVETLAKGGSAYGLPRTRMPHEADVAAILRY